MYFRNALIFVPNPLEGKTASCQAEATSSIPLDSAGQHLQPFLQAGRSFWPWQHVCILEAVFSIGIIPTFLCAILK